MSRKWTGATDKISFRLEPALREKLEKVAQATGRSTSWLIQFYVKVGLEREHAVKSDIIFIPSINGVNDTEAA